jgi:hypothetical protein
MLLRASSDAIDAGADLRGAVGGATGSVPHGGLLMAYAEAANRDPKAARALDGEVIAAIGEAGLVDAAVTVAVFNGLVRSADGIGIPLDDSMLAATAEARAVLGLDAFVGAANNLC